MLKVCKKCKKEKTRFQNNRHGNPGSVCVDCRTQEHVEYMQKHPKKLMVCSARQRARIKHLPFNLSEDDFEIPEYCPVLGMKLVGGNRKNHDASPSLDRIDPSQGYIAGNVVVISHKANRLKNDAGLAELEALVAWLKSPMISSDHAILATA